MAAVIDDIIATLKAIPLLGKAFTSVRAFFVKPPIRPIGLDTLISDLRQTPPARYSYILDHHGGDVYYFIGRITGATVIPTGLQVTIMYEQYISVTVTMSDKYDDTFRKVTTDGWWNLYAEAQLDLNHRLDMNLSYLYFCNPRKIEVSPRIKNPELS